MKHDNVRGRDIIAQVVETMRGQIEELRYSKIVSSWFTVHLHPHDHARIEELVPEIISQARRALNEQLDRMNRTPAVEDHVRRWLRQPRVPYERAGSEWSISIVADPNDELAHGDILVDATLVASNPDRYGGSSTRRIQTRRHGDQVEHRVALADAPEAETRPAQAKVIATLRWQDRQGEHTFQMTTPSIMIGRGGEAHRVDVRIDTVPDVSREHLRIRFDEASKQFFVQDLSTFGTTIEGVSIPMNSNSEGPQAAAAPEVRLPSRATIGLAGVATVSFEADSA